MIKPLGHTIHFGYCWKLCPYSEEYKTLYYDNSINGPSNHPDLFNNASWVALTTSAHPTTSGTMRYKHQGVPGWICLDTDCYYYTTVSSGVYYFES